MTESSEYLIKGTAVTAIVQFIKEKHGEEALRGVLAGVGPKMRNMIEGGVLVPAWYSLEEFDELVTSADRLLGRGDHRLVHDMGKFSASYGIKGVYKAFMKLGTPEFVLKRASSLWQRYYNHGTMEVVELKKGRFVARLHEFDYLSEVLCIRVAGWIERALEVSGAKDVQVVHTLCRSRGEPACEWQGCWS